MPKASPAPLTRPRRGRGRRHQGKARRGPGMRTARDGQRHSDAKPRAPVHTLRAARRALAAKQASRLRVVDG
ncbi:hypothetical protein CMUS01_05621 [Colletotrichum musicola]|uniref:Uncharacterized protein n=1 Tax=Colletotrichum musicola TaxID=2175873 RepID=A0A8H6KQI9_9PEZI|nr:hypothetical protein CMUS01_05621 [Colletotrichum musicola]